MDPAWWVTVVRAWPQENENSGLVIRMINAFGTNTDERSFASIQPALAQLGQWLQQLERAPIEPPSEGQERDADTTHGTWQHDD